MFIRAALTGAAVAIVGLGVSGASAATQTVPLQELTLVQEQGGVVVAESEFAHHGGHHFGGHHGGHHFGGHHFGGHHFGGHHGGHHFGGHHGGHRFENNANVSLNDVPAPQVDLNK